VKVPSFKFPSFKLDRLSRSSATADKGIQPPKFLRDLYADLRDRRLLPLVVLLLVAIAAVPFLLGNKDGEETSTEAQAIVVATPSSSNGSFSVVPAARQLRAYGDRLGYRKPRDPFDLQSTGSAGGGSEPDEKSEGQEGENDSTPEESEVQGESGESPAAEGPAESPTGGSTESGETPAAGTAEGDETPATITYVATGIDAKVGFLGHVRPQEKIPPMTKLPNPKNPVIVYMGESNDNKGALFLMSSNVSAFYGKGHCALSGQVCQLLELKPGQSASFAYGYGKARYKLQLKRLVGLTRTEHRKSKASVSSADPAPVHPSPRDQ
jgi:hypothetical protein